MQTCNNGVVSNSTKRWELNNDEKDVMLRYLRDCLARVNGVSFDYDNAGEHQKNLDFIQEFNDVLPRRKEILGELTTDEYLYSMLADDKRFLGENLHIFKIEKDLHGSDAQQVGPVIVTTEFSDFESLDVVDTNEIIRQNVSYAGDELFEESILNPNVGYSGENEVPMINLSPDEAKPMVVGPKKTCVTERVCVYIKFLFVKLEDVVWVISFHRDDPPKRKGTN